MAFKYTEDQLNKMDKTLIVELFLGLQYGMDRATGESGYNLAAVMLLGKDCKYIDS